MSAQSQYEREEEDIWAREARGEISREEAWREQRELQRDYQGAAEEAASRAYEAELERW